MTGTGAGCTLAPVFVLWEVGTMAKHRHVSDAPLAPLPILTGTPVDPFTGARRVWVAAKHFISGGTVWNPGDLMLDVEKLPGFRSMRNQRFIEAKARLSDGTLVDCPYVTRRLIDAGGKRYSPGRGPGEGIGDVVPHVRRWPNFRMLRLGEWLEPVNQARLEAALRLEG